MEKENLYQILGVSPNSTQEEITRRFRFLVQVYHPDRFQETSAKIEAEEEMKKINAAYSVLSNPQKRSEYDRVNRVNASSGSTSNPRRENTYPTESEQWVEYLLKLRDKWGPKVAHLLQEKMITDLTNLIQAGVALILQEAYPGKRIDQIRNITNQFDNGIFILFMLNLSLGAEMYSNNLPRGTSLSDIEALICYPLNQSIFETGQLIQKQGKLSSENNEILKKLSYLISTTCKTCQSIGHDYAEKSSRASTGDCNSEQTVDQNSKSNQSTGASLNEENQQVKTNDSLYYCQVCRRYSETARVHFEQNIGALVRRFHTTVEGYLCAECIEEYFWKFTGKTLLFGWWGIISCIVSPFILLGNLIQYMRTREVRKRVTGLNTISRGWKTTSIFSVLGIGFLIFTLFIQPGQVNNKDFFTPPTPKAINNVNPSNNALVDSSVTNRITPTTATEMKTLIAGINRPTPTAQECYSWSEITISDEGEYLCVTGNVRDAYFGGDIFYMIFGSRDNDFRLIVLDGYYYPDAKGNCVKTKGTVKAYGKMPYIEVSDNLFHCN